MWDPLSKRTVTSFVFNRSSWGTGKLPQYGPKNKAHFWHIQNLDQHKELVYGIFFFLKGEF